jgi:predicted deacylase
MNVAVDLGMIEGKLEKDEISPILCRKSYWIYTDHGGLLTVYPQLVQSVKENQLLAKQSDIFGNLKKEYLSPDDGVIIGKSVSPVNQTGGRVLHLGIV